jgi:hypothetical protein
MERPSSSSWRAFVSPALWKRASCVQPPASPRGGASVHCEFDQRSRPHIPDMIRIAITPAAFDAVVATLVLGTVAVEPKRAEDGSVHIWLDPRVLAKLKALRGRYQSTGSGSEPVEPTLAVAQRAISCPQPYARLVCPASESPLLRGFF